MKIPPIHPVCKRKLSYQNRHLFTNKSSKAIRSNLIVRISKYPR